MKFAVIGVGRFGYHVAATLASHGMQVLAVDSNEKAIAEIRDTVSQAICMTINDEESLRTISIEDMNTVIVALGDNFAQSVLITALLKQKIGIKRVITRATSPIHREILILVGADQVILPEREIGVRLADSLSLPFSNPLTRVTRQFSIISLTVPKRFIGKKIKELNLYENYHVTCIGHVYHDDVILTGSEYIISEGDVLYFAGSNEHLERLARL